MRICAIVGCGQPDVIAPQETGSWPTCSDKMPVCRDHQLAMDGLAPWPMPRASGPTVLVLTAAGNQ